MIDGAVLEVVDKFSYLGNMTSADGGYKERVIARNTVDQDRNSLGIRFTCPDL